MKHWEGAFFIIASEEYISYSTVLRIAFFHLKNFGYLQQHPFKSWGNKVTALKYANGWQ